jgi:Rrf2 family cysteine metabolism transcriptional repressor
MSSSSLITKKCRYALRAIFELSARNSGVPIKVKQIASSQGIPVRFLEVILAELKHGGFVEARRGSDGGYILTREPQVLTVGEVIEFVQGRIGSSKFSGDAPRGRRGDYVFARLWEQLSASISDVYNKTTFAALVEEEFSLRRGYVPDYAI